MKIDYYFNKNKKEKTNKQIFLKYIKWSLTWKTKFEKKKSYSCSKFLFLSFMAKSVLCFTAASVLFGFSWETASENERRKWKVISFHNGLDKSKREDHCEHFGSFGIAWRYQRLTVNSNIRWLECDREVCIN